MAQERVEFSRHLPVPASTVFELLRTPAGHVAIDSSGMLQSAEGDPVRAVGDEFVVHMDREALGDRPLGEYDVTVIITKFEQDRLLEWTIRGMTRPPLRHVYGYRLEEQGEGTLVTSYYDWSHLAEEHRGTVTFPVIPEAAIRATLGILARTVRSAER